MIIAKTKKEIKEHVQTIYCANKSIAFVPTMGSLHEGHLSLIRLAKRYAEIVIVSIFVNPTQFSPAEDLNTYPRNIENDVKKCNDEKIDYLFMPNTEEMYLKQTYLTIKMDQLTNELCGKLRPHFFPGVILVLIKLFNLVQPNVVVLGQKDIQQYIIIKQLIKELDYNIKLEMGNTIRTADGLALSSRNQYLTISEKKIASQLYKALQHIYQCLPCSHSTLNNSIEKQCQHLKTIGFKINYFNLYNYKTLTVATKLVANNKYILAASVKLGKTQLIDNILYHT